MRKPSVHSRFFVVSGLAGRAFLSAILVGLANGCQEGSLPNVPASETRDSAGIRIVANARPADDSRLPSRIGLEPTVSIGTVTGEEAYLLHQVDDAAVLPDGQCVADSHLIGVIDVTGT